MTDLMWKEIGIRQEGFTIQIPIFYKLMVSMLFVAIIPIVLLGMISTGDTESVIATLGLQNSIFILTLVTLVLVMMWSFYLSKSITTPIEQLAKVATSVSQGDLRQTEITVTSNDEIGELAIAFSRLINSYRLLDTLAKDDAE